MFTVIVLLKLIALVPSVASAIVGVDIFLDCFEPAEGTFTKG